MSKLSLIAHLFMERVYTICKITFKYVIPQNEEIYCAYIRALL